MSACHTKESRGENIVAHEHSHLIVVRGVHRSLSSTLLTLVHHVVMYERSGMKQLQTYGSVLRDISYLSEITRHKKYQHRAHSLACTLANMFERTTQQPVLV